MPGGLKARIVVPLVAVYLLTIGGGFALTDVFVRREVRRREELLDEYRRQLEQRVMGQARAVSQRRFSLQDVRAAENIRDILGYPYLIVDETGVLLTTLRGILNDAPPPRLWEMMRSTPEGKGDITWDDIGFRVLWTPVPDTGPTVRPRWIVVLMVGLPDPPTETRLHEPLRWIAAAGATLLAAAAYAVSWFWARRVTALSDRVEGWMREPHEPPHPPDRPTDEVARLARAFEDLRVRLEHYERELVSRERLATAGRIAAMMAHEIRNPLTALKLSAQMLREDLRSAAGPSPAQQEADETLAVMLREIGRLQILCDQLLTLSGKRHSVRESVDLPAAAADVCKLLAGQADQLRVTLRAESAAGVPTMIADGNELRQLIMNLVLNALAVSPPSARVEVTVTHAADEEGRPRRWILRVIDSGPGISDAAANPGKSDLLSNKPGGAGLGLAICEKIVQNHGGTLRLINRGDGTTAEAELAGLDDRRRGGDQAIGAD